MNPEIITKIGKLSFSVIAKVGDTSRAKIRTKKVTPKLPDEMSVENSTLVLLTMPALVPIEQLKFTCKLSESFPKGCGCTGEALDAWEWEDRNRLVVIGTEDGEWLESRLKLADITKENYPVHYHKNSIDIEIEKYSEGGTFSLHFAVSENPSPEEKDCSCWFSVDVSHDRVLREFGQS